MLSSCRGSCNPFMIFYKETIRGGSSCLTITMGSLTEGLKEASQQGTQKKKKSKKKKKRKKDPKYVHEKYKEVLKGQKSKDEGKAKVVAWSIYCKYKNPNSPRCKKTPTSTSQTEKAYEGRREMRSVARKVGKEMSQASR